MRKRCLPWSGLLVVSAATSAFSPTAASGEWPPPNQATSKDMADPNYWPSDPDYAYSEDANGQWELYSFVPKSSGTTAVRPDEIASGMSVDLAWRLSIGDDAVRLAIIDSGILWESGDLVDRVW